MTQIITGAPIWVWPLLALLVLLGLRARHTRSVPVVLIYTLPLLAIMPLRSTAALEAAVWIWLVFAAAFIAGAWGGYSIQGKWLLGFEGQMVRLEGESLTLIVMMVVFWANFAGGILDAVAPEVYASSSFQAPFVAIIAASSGTFGGRALRTFFAGRAAH